MSDPDILTMPVRDLIKGLRKKASELGDEHLITVLFNNAVVRRLEQEADRADACEKEEKHWRRECRHESDKVKALMECKPSAEALDDIADVMHNMKMPTEVVRAINEWADAVRKAEQIMQTAHGPTDPNGE